MKKIWLKNYPSSVPAELAEGDTGLLGEFEKTCQKFQNQTAFISFGVKLSYQDLYQKSFQLSQFLKDKKLTPGAVMAIQLPNLLQYPVSLWGSLNAGFKILNLNPLYTAREMLLPLQETQAQGIILLPNKLKELEKIISQTQIRFVLVTKPGDLLNQTDLSKKASFKTHVFHSAKKHLINLAYQYKTKTWKPVVLKKQYSFLSAFKEEPLIEQQEKPSKQNFDIMNKKRKTNETLFIQYTGGTTGLIKGACLTEKNILSNAKQCQTWMNHWLKASEETALAALPFYHIFSFTVNGLVFFFHGYPNVLVADPRNIKSLIHTIKKQKITVGTGVNTLFKALLSHKTFKSIKKKQLKTFVSGGMALNPSIREKWEAITQGFLVEGYGLTEASPVVCVDRLDCQKDNSSGYPLPSTEVRVVDDNNKELETNQVGELEVKGPQVMQGYYKHEEETKKVLNSEGWLKTGDLAKINPRGGIEILDRKKELINISGLKVYPREVEELLSLHPKIKEIAIIGRLDKKGEKIVKAYIVKKQDSLSKEEVISYCKQNLAPYKIPKEIIFYKSFIKSSVGKPLKYLLK